MIIQNCLVLRHLLVFLFFLNLMLSLTVIDGDVALGIDRDDERCSDGKDRGMEEGETRDQSLGFFVILAIWGNTLLFPTVLMGKLC